MQDVQSEPKKDEKSIGSFDTRSYENRLTDTVIHLRSALAPVVPLLYLHGLRVQRTTGGATIPTVSAMPFSAMWLLMAACVYVTFICVGVLLVNFHLNDSVYKPCEHIYCLALAIKLGFTYALVLKRRHQIADFINRIIRETALQGSTSMAKPTSFRRQRVVCLVALALPMVASPTFIALKWWATSSHCSLAYLKVPACHPFSINFCSPVPSDDNPDSITNPRFKERKYHHLAPTAELYPSSPPIYGITDTPAIIGDLCLYLHHFVLIPAFLCSLSAIIVICGLLTSNFRCLKFNMDLTQQGEIKKDGDGEEIGIRKWDPRQGPQLARLFDVDAFLVRHQSLASLVGDFGAQLGGLICFWSLVEVVSATYLLRSVNFQTYTATHHFLTPIAAYHIFALVSHIISTAVVNRQVIGSLQQIDLIFHYGDRQEVGDRASVMRTIALKHTLSMYMQKMASNMPFFSGAGFYIANYTLVFSVLSMITTYTMMSYGA